MLALVLAALLPAPLFPLPPRCAPLLDCRAIVARCADERRAARAWRAASARCRRHVRECYAGVPNNCMMEIR